MLDRGPGGDAISFTLDPMERQHLLAGLDEIALTLEARDDIANYERRRRAIEPRLFTAS